MIEAPRKVANKKIFMINLLFEEVIIGKGLEQISVEDLVSEITPRGRATIPDDIKADLLERIRKFLASN